MSSGRRDFGDIHAKLERYIERLPEQYAHRARETVRRYVPPNGQTRYQPPSGYRRPGAQGRPRPNPLAGLDPNLVSDVRAKLARWNEPAAKLERRKRRTSRALTLWIVLSILSVLWAVAAYAGIVSGSEGLAAAFSGIAATVVFTTLSVRSGLRLRQLNRTELPEPAPEPEPLPPASSAAREPMERLAEGEESLRELLRQLQTPSKGAPASVPEVSVEDARSTATEAADALRALSARIQAVERARDSAPESERAALDSAIGVLREQLDDGLEGYGSLVAAAGRAVAESSGGVEPAKEALTDATDRLAGLAMALRELS